jgi:MFS transporter, PHS family, inorganic phosphate transporter
VTVLKIALQTREEYPEKIERLLKANGVGGFNVRIYIVASFGFLASSYSLFATSIMWLALEFVYYPRGEGRGLTAGERFDLVTLSGIILGMIVFGHLADRVGRKRLYGLELIIIIIATLGITFSSNGYETPDGKRRTLDIFSAVTTWRFVLGVGIGAGKSHCATNSGLLRTHWNQRSGANVQMSEYPMSAMIAAEFVCASRRANTIASVFFMQSIGRLLALGFGNAFIMGQIISVGLDKADVESQKLAVDSLWRLIAGLGGFFAVLATALRLTIPESPRYYPGIALHLKEAMEPDATRETVESRRNPVVIGNSSTDYARVSRSSTKWLVGTWRYLTITPNAGKRFLMMCLLWFLLDICFYGTGLDSPTTLGLLSLTSPPPTSNDITNSTSYAIGTTILATSINANSSRFGPNVLYENGTRHIEVSSISSLVGSFSVLFLINRVSRRNLLVWPSLALSIVFFITGILVWTLWATPGSVASLVFYSLAQFLFNVGPNTVIFVLAAEIFPTMFRGTLCGIAAAWGKAGAMLIRPFVSIVANSNNHKGLAIMLFIYGAVMSVIAALAWFKHLLPEAQTHPSGKFPTFPQFGDLSRLNNKTLEDIAPNPLPHELAQTTSQGSPRGLIIRMRRLRPSQQQVEEDPTLLTDSQQGPA